MAQETEGLTSPPRRISIHSKSLAVAVALGTTDSVYELILPEAARFGAEVKNTGANALDAFAIQAKFHEDGNWVPLFSAGVDFTTPAGLMVDASGDLTALGAGATGWFVIDVLSLYAIRLLASAAVGASTLDIYGRAT